MEQGLQQLILQLGRLRIRVDVVEPAPAADAVQPPPPPPAAEPAQLHLRELATFEDLPAGIRALAAAVPPFPEAGATGQARILAAWHRGARDGQILGGADLRSLFAVKLPVANRHWAVTRCPSLPGPVSVDHPDHFSA